MTVRLTGWGQIESYCRILAQKIKESQFKPDIIVGVSRGGLAPALILSHLLEVRVVESIMAIRTETEGIEAKKSAPKVTYREFQGNILFVEDIVGTGETINEIKKIYSSCNYKVASLFLRDHCGIKPDYLAEISNCWVVFPWEKNEAKENIGDSVALISGGPDSAYLCWHILENTTTKLFPLYIKREATAENFEIVGCEHIVSELQKKYGTRVENLKTVTCTIPPKEIKQALNQQTVDERGYPLRNSLFLEIGALYCAQLIEKSNMISHLFIGNLVGDTFGESSVTFLKKKEEEFSLIPQLKSLKIRAPLLEEGLTKMDFFQVNEKEKIFNPEKLRSCASSQEAECGYCRSCLEQQQARMRWKNEH